MRFWSHLLGKDPAVLMLAIAMVVILVVAGLVVTYVAFPHRGEEIPGASWLGDAMSKANDRLPKLQDGDLDEGDPDHPGHADHPDERGEGYDRAS